MKYYSCNQLLVMKKKVKTKTASKAGSNRKLKIKQLLNNDKGKIEKEPFFSTGAGRVRIL